MTLKRIILLAAVCATATAWAEDAVTATYTSSKIDVALDNTTEFVAFQMDIKAADTDFNGKTVVLNGERLDQEGTAIHGSATLSAPFVLASNVLSDGTLRVIAYNLDNRPLSLNEGNLFEISIDGKPADVSLSNVRFVRKGDLAELELRATAVAGDDISTGIDETAILPEASHAYDLQGRRVANPAYGVYVIKGKKQIMK